MSTSAQRLQRLDPRVRLQPGALRITEEAPLRLVEVVDIAAVLALLVLAAALTLTGPGDVRIVVGTIAVFCLPGYLLLEAIAPSHRAAPSRRALRPLLALGLGPPVVALAALAAALVPHGFSAPGIIAAVLLASFGLAAVAVWRRAREPASESLPDAWWGVLQRALQRRA